MIKKKNVFIALSAVAALGLAALILLLTAPAPETVDDTGSAADSGSSALPMFTKTVAEVQTVTVTNANGGFVLRSQMVTLTDSDGNKTEEQQFFTDGLENAPQDETTINGFVDSFTPMNARGLIESDASDLGKYGLAQPISTITLSYADGGSETLQVGNPAPGSGQTYAKMADSADVYTVSSSFLTGHDQSNLYFVSRKLMKDYTDYGSPAVSRITIDGPAVNDIDKQPDETETESEPIIIELISERIEGDRSTGVNSYEFVSPLHLEIADDLGSDLIYGMFELNASDVALVDLTEEEKDRAGLNTPTVVITMLAGAKTYTLALGAAVAPSDGSEISQLFGNFSETPDVLFIFNIVELPWLMFNYESVMSKMFILPSIYTVSALTIETPADTLNFTITGNPDDPDDTESYEFFYNGALTDTARFKTLYQFVIGMQAESLYTESLVGEEFVVRYTFEYNDGRENDVIELYKSTDRKLIVVKNGEVLYKMRYIYSERLTQNIDAFKNGGTIVTNY
jgi:hypothetical protein